MAALKAAPLMAANAGVGVGSAGQNVITLTRNGDAVCCEDGDVLSGQWYHIRFREAHGGLGCPLVGARREIV
jgi:hypothetical protein